ncbi:ADP-ribosylation [Suillus lakei]|nr:ADP-ribosylation [Suillus lakei]
MALGMCDFCGIKPKYPPHQFCGKTCAAQSSALRNLCKYCQSAPRYNDGNITHPYCGKTCAKKAKNAGLDCGVTSPDTRACLLCKRRSQSKRFRHYCSSQCLQKAEQNAPQLLEIPSYHDDYTNVENQFYAAWRGTGTARPTVQHIYKIVVPSNISKRYEDYRAKVESQGHFAGQRSSNGKTMTKGNENRRWHGTKRDCNLGDPGNSGLCSSTSCALCSIIKDGFKASNGYIQNLKPSPLKAMLLNHVVVGKGHKLMATQTNLKQAPNGFDSVLADIGHDELIVYDDDAVRPCYLVMYA